MLKSATALMMALTAGGALFGAATGASAGECGACGPLPPIHHKHVIYKNIEVWRHHQKLVIKPIPRRQEIIDVTEIQPVKHVHDVLDVTIKSVPGPVYNVYTHHTHVLPEKVVYTSQTFYHHVGCGCRD